MVKDMGARNSREIVASLIDTSILGKRDGNVYLTPNSTTPRHDLKQGWYIAQ
jgi:hypothetical protein